MKKIFFILVFTVLAGIEIYPQAAGIITNSTILKMAKAKLSDELIIDEIKNSTTRFNISPDSILFLSNNYVSAAVIREMKIVTGNLQPVTETPEPVNTPPVAVQAKETVSPETKSPAVPESKKTEEVKVSPVPANEISVSSEALGYVIPLQELIRFFENEFKALEGTIKTWDAKIRVSVEDGNKIRERILNLEKELAGKINADSKGFTEEINALKSKLSETRESYGIYQNNMVSDGLKMVKEIEDIGSRLDRSITDKYGQTGQDVKKTDPDLSLNTVTKSMTITNRKVNDAVVDYVAPLSMILFFYQNEIASLDRTIDQWNEKIAAVTRNDKEILQKLEPLKKELENLQADQKKNKKPITELKKQISDLDKERKALNQQISDDSEDLAKYLALSCKTVQSSLEERIADIIEDIKYSYQDSFTYKSL